MGTPLHTVELEPSNQQLSSPQFAFADKGEEAEGFEVFFFVGFGAGSGDAFHDLPVFAAHRNDQLPAWVFELFQDVFGDTQGSGGDEDFVERRKRRPAERAIATLGNEVIFQRTEDFLGAAV